MITSQDYFAAYADSKEITEEFRSNAETLLYRVNDLLNEAVDNGILIRCNPKTKTNVSGSQDGGWRPSNCQIGASKSAHKQAQAVDVYDPGNALDGWITAHPEVLEAFDLYREDPASTPNWCHLSTRAPRSGKRTFLP